LRAEIDELRAAAAQAVKQLEGKLNERQSILSAHRRLELLLDAEQGLQRMEVCIYIRVCVCACSCARAHVHARERACAHVHVHVRCECVCVCVCVRVQVRVRVRVCMIRTGRLLSTQTRLQALLQREIAAASAEEADVENCESANSAERSEETLRASEMLERVANECARLKGQVWRLDEESVSVKQVRGRVDA